MSSNLPESLSSFKWESRIADEPPPPLKDWALSFTLLLLTILSTSFIGFLLTFDLELGKGFSLIIKRPGLLSYGLSFSLPLIAILLAHELGHYLACRYYGMSCTPPYFIPSPLGTFGAFIKIKSRFLDRRSLFDIGIAGPLAGFIFTLPTLWIGIGLSQLAPKGLVRSGALNFGEPIILRLLGELILGYSPTQHEMHIHPIALAAWGGLLATSINLLPIWQLDGGHISYAMIGRPLHKKLSIASLIILILMSLAEWVRQMVLMGLPQWWRLMPPYLLFIVLLLIIGIRSRFFHPPTIFDEEKLGPGRFMLGLIASIILIITFMPVPISLY